MTLQTVKTIALTALVVGAGIFGYLRIDAHFERITAIERVNAHMADRLVATERLLMEAAKIQAASPLAFYQAKQAEAAPTPEALPAPAPAPAPAPETPTDE